MSYSVPGPSRDDRFLRIERDREQRLVEQARQALPKPPGEDREMVASAPARPAEKRTKVDPPVLDQLLRHEEARAAAREAGDRRLAANALAQVTGDLDALLVQVRDHLRQSGRGRSRQVVREAAPRLTAMSGVAALPLGEVADLLDVPRQRVEGVLDTIARHGGMTPAERHDALEQVDWLRAQVSQVRVAEDHSRLDRLLRFLPNFLAAALAALAAAAAGAWVVGESVVKEVVKTAVIALVAAGVKVVTDRLRGTRDPGDADDAHAALLADLHDVRSPEPAYTGEHAILRLKLEVHCCTAKIASIPVDWPDKHAYWSLLTEIVEAAKSDRVADLRVLRRKLQALRPPAA